MTPKKILGLSQFAVVLQLLFTSPTQLACRVWFICELRGKYGAWCGEATILKILPRCGWKIALKGQMSWDQTWVILTRYLSLRTPGLIFVFDHTIWKEIPVKCQINWDYTLILTLNDQIRRFIKFALTVKPVYNDNTLDPNSDRCWQEVVVSSGLIWFTFIASQCV